MLVRRYHPDIVGSGSAEKFREVQEAYETLGESSRRQADDMALRERPRRVHVTVIYSETSSPQYAEPLITARRRDPCRAPSRMGRKCAISFFVASIPIGSKLLPKSTRELDSIRSLGILGTMPAYVAWSNHPCPSLRLGILYLNYSK
jgi:curved DNA-binding protein CbpA